MLRHSTELCNMSYCAFKDSTSPNVLSGIGVTMRSKFISLIMPTILVILVGLLSTSESTAQSINAEADMGNFEAIKQRVEKDKKMVNFVDNGTRPLHHAAYSNRIEIVKYLLDNGAEINAVQVGGPTALGQATFRGNSDVVKYLLDKGANPDLGDEKGATPLHHAAYAGNMELVKLLISHNANVNLQQKDGGTPLSHSSIRKHNEVAKYLLENKANPNIADNKGSTPLHHAAYAGNSELVKMLLIYAANPNATQKDGGTVLGHAKGHGNTETVQMILKARGEKSEGSSSKLPPKSLIKGKPFFPSFDHPGISDDPIIELLKPHLREKWFYVARRSGVESTVDSNIGIISANNGGTLMVRESKALFGKNDNPSAICRVYITGTSPGVPGWEERERRMLDQLVGGDTRPKDTGHPFGYTEGYEFEMRKGKWTYTRSQLVPISLYRPLECYAWDTDVLLSIFSEKKLPYAPGLQVDIDINIQVK